jgi:superfamily II DNA or RNA helicase
MTFVHLHEEFPELAQRGTLVMVHRDELIRQTAATYKRVYPHLTVHVERGSDVADPAAADVIIASVQSLGRKGSGERRTERLQHFGLIIVDEVRVRTNFTVCILCRKLLSVLCATYCLESAASSYTEGAANG